MQEYRHLRVYQASLALVEIVADATRRFPPVAEKLRKQLDDAADGIGSNIAEGCGRKNKRHSNVELIRYLHMSFAETNEVQHRIQTAHMRRYVTEMQYWQVHNRAQAIKKMLRAWVARLQRDDRGRVS
jgi:four helix bundle protein